MKSPDQLITDIAREHLGIQTLNARMSDTLDFHDIAVWQVKAALNAAFAAGATNGACQGLSTGALEQDVIRELLEALEDLLGDLPSVQGAVCRHCGREYHDLQSGDCPSDDCPSFTARAAIAHAKRVAA